MGRSFSFRYVVARVSVSKFSFIADVSSFLFMVANSRSRYFSFQFEILRFS